MYDYILPFLWSFLLAVFAIPSIIFVAHIKNLLDEPNKRTVHMSLTPRLGGLAIFAAFMSSLTIFGTLDFGIQQLLAGCIILFFIGLKDDLVSVSAFKKFFVQILAAGIIIFIGDIRITSFQGVFGIFEIDDKLSYLFTFLVIMGISNSINLIDGMDGLAGSILLIITLSFGLYLHYYGGEYYSAYAMVAVCLVGGILGFLRFNFKNALIFMGDTGSLVSGLIVAVLAIKFIEMNKIPAGPSVAVSILVVPIFDTLRVFTIRVINGVSPFSPDKNHLHHQLLKIGLKQGETLFILIFFNILVILISIYFSNAGNSTMITILASLFIITNLIIELLVKNKVKKSHA
ncbi:undecaprenyl/decaprenyl-phosphate alpha-N-acetylglucosaminyl 1-phosphate transferase [Hyphobacterium sp. CCMP332]|nr:undecaprenyl/decaprenyl-phosphate alpha-N-acetylglucosaminyl 1-phosphate transferase [Hyphobacterium sp. CCMP332]